jgi:hypothetical protein
MRKTTLEEWQHMKSGGMRRGDMKRGNARRTIAWKEQCKKQPCEEHRERNNIRGAMWNKKLETKN